MGLLKDSTKLREQLLSKNLYNYKDAYDLSRDEFTSILNKSLSLGIELRRNLFIDTIERLSDNTSLVNIGYQQLAKSLQNRIADRFLSNNLEVTPTTISFKGKSSFKSKDFKITPYVNQNVSEVFINEFLGYNSDDNLPRLTLENDLFNNLGDFQKRTLISNISKNRFYNPIFDSSITEKPKQKENFVYSNRYLSQDNTTYQSNIEPNLNIDIQKPSDTVLQVLDNYDIEFDMGFGNTKKPYLNNLSDEEKYLYYSNLSDDDLNNKFNIKRGLLYYTNKIITDKSIDNKISKTLDALNIEYGVDENTGNRVYRGASECRSFTIADQYDRFERLIRSNGNDNSKSVLRDSPSPKIFFKNSDSLDEKKRVSFSIENLAVNKKGIPDCEIGPNGGRLLWFVPYDLKISDNNSINWESKDIVGRIEKLYSYTNTERRLSLTFKLLMDFPPQFKEYFEQDTTNYTNLVSYIQGCLNTNNNSTPQVNQTQVITTPTINQPKTKIPSITVKPIVYFDNDIDIIDSSYEFTNLNKEYDKDIDLLVEKLIENINVNRKKIQIKILGQASSLYLSDYNAALSFRRSKAIMLDIIERYNNSQLDKSILPNIVLENFNPNERFNYIKKEDVLRGVNNLINESKGYVKFLLGGFGEEPSNSTQVIPVDATDFEKNKIINDIKAKKERNSRVTDVEFIGDINISDNTTTSSNITQNTDSTVTLGNDNNINIVNIPCDDDYLDFQARNITDRIKSSFDNFKYLTPIFHSQTPYDFVKRYLFLQQLTRPGSTEDRINQIGGNSVFGKMPVIVIKLYDFIYSKAICNSINFSFDDATWDFNPEGMGAIPMSCTVTMDMVLIGGQSLSGPIDKIQTADDFNFLSTSTFESNYYQSYSIDKAKQQEINQEKLNQNKK
jgi:hypothetical protein